MPERKRDRLGADVGGIEIFKGFVENHELIVGRVVVFFHRHGHGGRALSKSRTPAPESNPKSVLTPCSVIEVSILSKTPTRVFPLKSRETTLEPSKLWSDIIVPSVGFYKQHPAEGLTALSRNGAYSHIPSVV